MKIAELVSTFQQLSPAEQRSVLNTLERAVEANAQPERLADLQVKYPGEWLAIVIPDGEDRYAPEHGYLLAHDSDRLTVWQKVDARAADRDVFVFFSGPPPAICHVKESYAKHLHLAAAPEAQTTASPISLNLPQSLQISNPPA